MGRAVSQQGQQAHGAGRAVFERLHIDFNENRTFSCVEVHTSCDRMGYSGRPNEVRALGFRENGEIMFGSRALSDAPSRRFLPNATKTAESCLQQCAVILESNEMFAFCGSCFLLIENWLYCWHLTARHQMLQCACVLLFCICASHTMGAANLGGDLLLVSSVNHSRGRSGDYLR